MALHPKDDAAVPAWAADFWSRFLFVWTLTLAYKQLAFYDTIAWLPVIAQVALVASVAVALLEPRIATVAPLLCLDAWIVFRNFPAVPNHWVLTALVEVLLLSVWSARAVAGKSRRWEVETVAMAVRHALCLVYVVAAFHKLNADFFEPAVSCAVTMAGPLRVFGRALPAMAVAGELLVPLLLLLPSTRLRYGVPAGLAMHALFAVSALPPLGIFEFSIVAMSLYWVFFVGPVAPDDARDYQVFVRDLMPRFPVGLRTTLAAVFVVSSAALALSGAEGGKAISRYLWPAVVFVPTLVWIYARQVGSAPVAHRARAARSAARFPALVAGGLVVSFGLSPYLGLKGVPAFSMFSNLRTETARWNHYLLPPSVKVFDFEDDTVLIRSDQGGARGWFDPKPGMLLPYETLICMLADRATPRYPDRERVIRGTRTAGSREIEATYRDGSVRIDGAKVECPLWKSKLLRFRPQTVAPHRKCSW